MTHYTDEQMLAMKKSEGRKGISQQEFNRRLAAIAGCVRGPGGEWVQAPPSSVKVSRPMSLGTPAKTKARFEMWKAEQIRLAAASKTD